MTAAFDTAAAVAATPFPFSCDITPAARPVAVDGNRDLVERGHHRDAVFWIAATYARCLTILASDAPAAAPGHNPGFQELLGDLGITAPADLGGGGPGTCAASCPASGGSPRRSWPRTRPPATDPQLTAFFTSAAIFFSSAAVSSVSAKEVGHMVPSSRFASSLKPNVAYLDLNFDAAVK
jgi:hypothetical protein